MSSPRFTNYSNFNADVVKDIREIADKIQDEQKSENPDSKTISQLMYQQLMKGMALNSVYNRYYYKPF